MAATERTEGLPLGGSRCASFNNLSVGAESELYGHGSLFGHGPLYGAAAGQPQPNNGAVAAGQGVMGPPLGMQRSMSYTKLNRGGALNKSGPLTPRLTSAASMVQRPAGANLPPALQIGPTEDNFKEWLAEQIRFSESLRIPGDKRRKEPRKGAFAPFKALSRIGSRKSKCSFSMFVHGASSLPAEAEGRELLVRWQRKGMAVGTNARVVRQGLARIEQPLHLTCTMFFTVGQNSSVKCQSKVSTVDIRLAGTGESPPVVLATHHVDLASLMPATLSDATTKPTTLSFSLSSKGGEGGGTVVATFGYELELVPGQMRMVRADSLAFRSDSLTQPAASGTDSPEPSPLPSPAVRLAAPDSSMFRRAVTPSAPASQAGKGPGSGVAPLASPATPGPQAAPSPRATPMGAGGGSFMNMSPVTEVMEKEAGVRQTPAPSLKMEPGSLAAGAEKVAERRTLLLTAGSAAPEEEAEEVEEEVKEVLNSTPVRPSKLVPVPSAGAAEAQGQADAVGRVEPRPGGAPRESRSPPASESRSPPLPEPCPVGQSKSARTVLVLDLSDDDEDCLEEAKEVLEPCVVVEEGADKAALAADPYAVLLKASEVGTKVVPVSTPRSEEDLEAISGQFLKALGAGEIELANGRVLRVSTLDEEAAVEALAKVLSEEEEGEEQEVGVLSQEGEGEGEDEGGQESPLESPLEWEGVEERRVEGKGGVPSEVDVEALLGDMEALATTEVVPAVASLAATPSQLVSDSEGEVLSTVLRAVEEEHKREGITQQSRQRARQMLEVEESAARMRKFRAGRGKQQKGEQEQEHEHALPQQQRQRGKENDAAGDVNAGGVEEGGGAKPGADVASGPGGQAGGGELVVASRGGSHMRRLRASMLKEGKATSGAGASGAASVLILGDSGPGKVAPEEAASGPRTSLTIAVEEFPGEGEEQGGGQGAGLEITPRSALGPLSTSRASTFRVKAWDDSAPGTGGVGAVGVVKGAGFSVSAGTGEGQMRAAAGQGRAGASGVRRSMSVKQRVKKMEEDMRKRATEVDADAEAEGPRSLELGHTKGVLGLAVDAEAASLPLVACGSSDIVPLEISELGEGVGPADVEVVGGGELVLRSRGEMVSVRRAEGYEVVDEDEEHSGSKVVKEMPMPSWVRPGGSLHAPLGLPMPTGGMPMPEAQGMTDAYPDASAYALALQGPKALAVPAGKELGGVPVGLRSPLANGLTHSISAGVGGGSLGVPGARALGVPGVLGLGPLEGLDLRQLMPGAADPLTLAAPEGLAPPALVQGLGSAIATVGGGMLASMSGHHFEVGASRLLMQFSRPMVVPSEMGSDAQSVMQTMALALEQGSGDLCEQLQHYMPLPDLAGKPLEQIAAEGLVYLEYAQGMMGAAEAAGGVGIGAQQSYVLGAGGRTGLLEGASVSERALAVEKQQHSSAALMMMMGGGGGRLLDAGSASSAEGAIVVKGPQHLAAVLKDGRKAQEEGEQTLHVDASYWSDWLRQLQQRGSSVCGALARMNQRGDSDSLAQGTTYSGGIVPRGAGGEDLGLASGGEGQVAFLGREAMALEEIAPCARDHLEAFALEGLRIQAAVSDTEAPARAVLPGLLGQGRVASGGGATASLAGAEPLHLGAVGVGLLEGPSAGGGNASMHGQLVVHPGLGGGLVAVPGIMDRAKSLEDWQSSYSSASMGELKDEEATLAVLAAHNAIHGPVQAVNEAIRHQQSQLASQGETGLRHMAPGAAVKAGPAQEGGGEAAGPTVTIAVLVQLRDPMRNFEPVGAPMVALLQAEKVDEGAPSAGEQGAKLLGHSSRLALEHGTGEGVDLPLVGVGMQRGNASSIEAGGHGVGQALGAEAGATAEGVAGGAARAAGVAGAAAGKPKFKLVGVHMMGLKTEEGSKRAWGTEKAKQSGSRWVAAQGMASKKAPRKPPAPGAAGRGAGGLGAKGVPGAGKGKKEVKVQPGDTMWSLSQKIHGTGMKWKDVARLNPQVRNPDLILPNQKLRMA